MTINNQHSTYIAVNSTEWLNLCARGSIRMSKRRAITVPEKPSHTHLEKLFAAAPYTKIDSSIDLLLLDITPTWSSKSRKHRSNPSEIFHLSLEDVLSHHTVSLEHLDYYKSVGERCGVEVHEPRFEKDWQLWVFNESVIGCIDGATRLQTALGVTPSFESKRSDKYKWTEVAGLILRPNAPVKARPAHIETLLTAVRDIADAVSGISDSEQFYIACNIEWVDHRLRRDPMSKKSNKEFLLNALSNAKEFPLSTEPSDATNDALTFFSTTFPKAYTDEITPVLVAHLVRILTEARSKSLKLETAISIVSKIKSESLSASLLTFALATTLGPELTSQLIRASSFNNLVEIDWTTPN